MGFTNCILVTINRDTKESGRYSHTTYIYACGAYKFRFGRHIFSIQDAVFILAFYVLMITNFQLILFPEQGEHTLSTSADDDTFCVLHLSRKI